MNARLPQVRGQAKWRRGSPDRSGESVEHSRRPMDERFCQEDHVQLNARIDPYASPVKPRGPDAEAPVIVLPRLEE